MARPKSLKPDLLVMQRVS